MNTLGERLKQIRKEQGLSETAFAERFGVSRSAQVTYEGNRRSPPGDYLLALRAAGIDIFYVLTGEMARDSISPEAAELVRIFEAMGPDQQKVLLASARLMAPRSATIHDNGQHYRFHD